MRGDAELEGGSGTALGVRYRITQARRAALSSPKNCPLAAPHWSPVVWNTWPFAQHQPGNTRGGWRKYRAVQATVASASAGESRMVRAGAPLITMY